MHATNTIRMPCRRLVRVGDIVFAETGDEAWHEFCVPIGSFTWGSKLLESDFFPIGAKDTHIAMLPFGFPLFTHCAINGQDGSQVWYAFSEWYELKFFRTLMLADGIGPKSAFNIIDKNGWAAIKDIVVRGDQAAFRKLKGVGEKTAAKLFPFVFPNREDRTDDGPKSGPLAPRLKNQVVSDAEGTLMSLGYKKTDAEAAVAKAIAAMKPDSVYDAELLVKMALKRK